MMPYRRLGQPSQTHQNIRRVTTSIRHEQNKKATTPKRGNPPQSRVCGSARPTNRCDRNEQRSAFRKRTTDVRHPLPCHDVLHTSAKHTKPHRRTLQVGTSIHVFNIPRSVWIGNCTTSRSTNSKHGLITARPAQSTWNLYLALASASGNPDPRAHIPRDRRMRTVLLGHWSLRIRFDHARIVPPSQISSPTQPRPLRPHSLRSLHRPAIPEQLRAG